MFVCRWESLGQRWAVTNGWTDEIWVQIDCVQTKSSLCHPVNWSQPNLTGFQVRAQFLNSAKFHVILSAIFLTSRSTWPVGDRLSGLAHWFYISWITVSVRWFYTGTVFLLLVASQGIPKRLTVQCNPAKEWLGWLRNDAGGSTY